MIFYTADIAASLQQFMQQGNYNQALVLTDNNTFGIASAILGKHISPENYIIIPAGEQHKNLGTAQLVWETLKSRHADRNSVLVNFGGGMVTDIGGFCAATYMRGIPFINIPTSLLCMVDAAVGGKNGLNFGNIKNIIGTFSNPAAVVIHTPFLASLPEEELRSGWGEVIKHGIIAGGKLWETAKNGIPEITHTKIWQEIIEANIVIKSEVVQQDPKESGLRKILNFGHTIGHALEAEYMKNSGFISHGHAVALGLVLESMVGLGLQQSTADVVQDIRMAVERVFPRPQIPEEWIPNLLESMLSDKKTSSGQLFFSIPRAIGQVVPNIAVPADTVKKAISEYNRYAVAV